MDKRGIEAIRALMGVARDGDRSMVERVIALETAYHATVDAASSSEEIDEVIAAAGINGESFFAWVISDVAAVCGAYRANHESILKGKAMGITMELFPTVAHGGGGGDS